MTLKDDFMNSTSSSKHILSKIGSYPEHSIKIQLRVEKRLSSYRMIKNLRYKIIDEIGVHTCR